jgi:signal transduction histidine kinase
MGLRVGPPMIKQLSQAASSHFVGSKLKSIFGVGSEAQIELLHMNARSWRHSLTGAALLNLVVAWVFKLSAPTSSLWLWASLGWLTYLGVGVLCSRYDARPADKRAFEVWWIGTLLLSVVVGILWSSLAWWLPATPAIQLLAALASGMISLGSASTSVSVGTLLAVGLPMLLIVPAALLWHAQLPVAAAVAFGVEMLIWRHGLVLHRNMLATIVQRRQVESLSQQLKLQQSQLQEAERERGVMSERQRLLRDMHDGVGASLISALKMIELGRMNLDEAAQVLRECLDDLRLVIDSLEPIDHDLVTLLATLRYRIGGRLERAGMAIEWEMTDVPPLHWLNAPQALEVLRIVQEALANILKHSRARRVRVSMALESAPGMGRVAALSVDDDGVGFDPNASTHGRGVKHMRHRARQIGGRFDIEAAPGGGTRVCLRLSLDGTLGPQANPG